MYPEDKFNQLLQAALAREQWVQVVIEISEAYGDHYNRTLDLDRTSFDSLEYMGGVLEIRYVHSEKDRRIEFLPWHRILGISINDSQMPVQFFSNLSPQISTII